MQIIQNQVVDKADSLNFTGPHGEHFIINVLDHDLIRVRHYPDGHARLDRTWLVVDETGDVPIEGRSRDDLSPFPKPDFDVHHNDFALIVQTQQLRLEVMVPEFRLRWLTAASDPFAADLRGRAYPYDRAGRSVFHYMERYPDEHYLGFGERSGGLDKKGRRMRMVNTDAMGYNAKTTDPLYKHFPFYITWLPKQQIAYGIFYDNLANSVFDMGAEIEAYYGDFRYYQADDGDIDYYFIYGPSIPEVVRKMNALTGRMALPPRWSLGYLGSTMAYTEADDAQDQLANFVNLCQQHEIPCDMFHLSSGYTTNEAGQRMVFTWNHNKIPQPVEMVNTFHDGGIHVTANIKPYFLQDHPDYETLREQGWFIRAADDEQPQAATFWSGGSNESGEGAYLDFTNPEAVAWWQRQVQGQLLDYGVDATWNDNNEFQISDDQARCFGFGESIPISMARPLQTLLMVHASYAAQLGNKPNERPYLLSRSALPGLQRYACSWSGDNLTDWETLRYNIPMGLGMGLSGFPNIGHDVGGFAGERPNSELFVRWVQNGVFHPRFTIHSWNDDGSVNTPWMHPDVLPIVRSWILFRYRLMPYLYSLVYRAAHTGDPIIRPTVYEFPNEPLNDFDFLLGDSLLVASVLERGQQTREVRLPAGEWWCDYYTGMWHMGGQTILADAPLDRIPLFVRGNGVIPMGKAMPYVNAVPDDLRRVYLYPCPEAHYAEFALVEDDGVSLDYLNGHCTHLTFELTTTSDAISLHVTKDGSYPLPYERLEVVLPPDETRPLKVDAEFPVVLSD